MPNHVPARSKDVPRSDKTGASSTALIKAKSYTSRNIIAQPTGSVLNEGEQNAPLLYSHKDIAKMFCLNMM